MGKDILEKKKIQERESLLHPCKDLSNWEAYT